jgi:hypothetical protein
MINYVINVNGLRLKKKLENKKMRGMEWWVRD